jgi:hypothetical protein
MCSSVGGTYASEKRQPMTMKMEMQCVYYDVGTEKLRCNLDSFHISKSSKFRASYKIKSHISL